MDIIDKIEIFVSEEIKAKSKKRISEEEHNNRLDLLKQIGILKEKKWSSLGSRIPPLKKSLFVVKFY